MGHNSIWFGNGNIQYANQARPTWIPGNIPAQITAKMVIASAARLMDVRHFCLKRNRIAEISVPAWPIPTQNTKFTMAYPQPTGLLTPQVPTPQKIRNGMKTPSNPNTENASRKKPHQPIVGLFSTIPHTLSVMVVLSLSPVMSGVRLSGEYAVLSISGLSAPPVNSGLTIGLSVSRSRFMSVTPPPASSCCAVWQGNWFAV